MSILLQIIGVIIGLILMCGVAATPINKYIDIIKEKIIFIPKPTIIIPIETTITPAPLPIQINNYPEISNFLNNLPKCNWCSACGSYARYTYLEAEKQDIPIGEITIVDPNRKRVKKLLMNGHRINYFYADDGHRVYIDNMHNWGLILETHELKGHIKDKFGFNLNRISFKNQKNINSST